jgi:hypothetical protein
MDTLHTVLRSIRGDSKSRRDHLSVFREFLDHLDRVTRSRAARPRASGYEDQRRAAQPPQHQIVIRSHRSHFRVTAHLFPRTSMLAPYDDLTQRVFRPAHHHRRRRHGGRLCQPIRRARPVARHGGLSFDGLRGHARRNPSRRASLAISTAISLRYSAVNSCAVCIGASPNCYRTKTISRCID